MEKDIEKIVYLSEQEFAKINTTRVAPEAFLNPYRKKIGNVTYAIIPKNEECTAVVLNEKDKAWYTSIETDEPIVKLSVRLMCSFPTELVAGTKYIGWGLSRFAMNNELSDKTGWILPNGCLGSCSELFLKSKVNEAIAILNEHGFNFPTIQ